VRLLYRPALVILALAVPGAVVALALVVPLATVPAQPMAGRVLIASNPATTLQVPNAELKSTVDTPRKSP
jgi:hypothetical protein